MRKSFVFFDETESISLWTHKSNQRLRLNGGWRCILKALRSRVFFVLILTLSLGLSGCALQTGAIQEERNVKYTLFIGLNDKDTYEQLIPSEEAEQIMTDIALKYVDGFTVYPARGTYKDEKGVITKENSLVVEFSDATELEIKDIMDELLEELNQNSILLEKQSINSEFYEGEEP